MGVKYVFVTGGVVSGLGKGITAASLGRLLKARGYHVTMQKLDPYINVDPLMKLLSVPAGAHRIHHDIFRGHEGQFAAQMFCDDFRIDHQPIHHVKAKIQDTVCCQKSFRDRYPLVCGVVQSPLEPLGSGSDRRI